MYTHKDQMLKGGTSRQFSRHSQPTEHRVKVPAAVRQLKEPFFNMHRRVWTTKAGWRELSLS